MQITTPIQQAIIELAKREDAKSNRAVAECIVMLMKILPKEKEFISNVWDKAHEKGRRFHMAYKKKCIDDVIPDKTTFINQLYETNDKQRKDWHS